MRVLVAGGAGFLGSHLIDRLLIEGNYVIGCDNLSTGTRHNLKQHHNNPNFEFIEHDIIEPFELSVDQIYNLACPASPKHYQSDPIQTIRTSFVGTYNLLEIARQNNCKFLQASTSEVYGDPLQHPQSETYFGNVNTTGPRSCYDEGKRSAETLVSDYNRIYGVETKIVRIFNTFGPRMQKSDGRVVSNFITQALAGDPITIFGDGTQTRSLCYVDDLIDAIMCMMRTGDNVRGPINIGSDREITIAELSEKILNLVNSSSQITYNEPPKDDPKIRRPNLNLARDVLQWKPTTELTEGLRKTIKYFRKVNK